MRSFDNYGIHFEYPDAWELTEEQGEDQITLTVQGPETVFWSVTIIPGRPEAETLLDLAMAPFRELYPEMDVYESAEKICLLPTVGCDIDFVCLELINRASLRVCEAWEFSVLVLHQSSDANADLRETLHEITDSLVCIDPDEDDETPFDPSQIDSMFRSR